MIERSLERFDLYPSRLLGDSGYGSAGMLAWLVYEHGIEPHVDGGHVTIRAARDSSSGMLELTVADTGLGLDAPPQDGTRAGNANLRERLQVLYGDRASFELIPNAPQGALARIRIPL